MGLKITNMTEVVTSFKLVDKYVTEEARACLYAYANAIRDTAVDYAPVLKHRIEKAIHLLPARGNQYSLHLIIAVTGYGVDSYAAIVHEYSWNKRGPLTRAKGDQAGPRYLFRAVEKYKKNLERDLAEAMSRGISKGITRSGVNKRRRR